MGATQSASQVKWQTALDDDRAAYGYGSDVLIHFAAPMVTAANTVVYALRYTTTGSSGPIFDNWKVVGRSAATGAVGWQLNTDYSAAVIWPNDWTSVFPATLFPSGAGQGVAAAGAAGSVWVRNSGDNVTSPVSRVVFYTSLADFNANKTGYLPIKICTPIISDKSGNLFFGYEVTATVPSSASKLGSGGIAKVNALTGVGSFVSVAGLAIDSSLSRPAINAAPALSNDGESIYVALTGGSNVLAKLSTANLALEASVVLQDPSVAGQARLINESSASPMVGPDGHVFMGVFGNQWRESHGWTLQFDADLKSTNAFGKALPVGAFGWDDTPSVVPAYAVPSYHGRASYLILCKYNNYDDNGSDAGADGSNKVAVLDPTSNDLSVDRQTGIKVMNEILTVLGPTKTNDDAKHPDARNEWCINSAAIDVNGKAAIINSEDGHMYRWSFVTNQPTETLDLQPATGEAYTETAVGPDGQLYVINNAILFAIGANQATGVSVYQGTAGVGSLSDIWFVDGKTYSTSSVPTATGGVAAIEADFTVNPPASPSSLSINTTVISAPFVTGQIYAYNFIRQQFVLVGSGALSNSSSNLSATLNSGVAQYIGPGGAVRLLVRGVSPARRGQINFPLALDQISCGIH